MSSFNKKLIIFSIIGIAGSLFTEVGFLFFIPLVLSISSLYQYNGKKASIILVGFLFLSLLFSIFRLNLLSHNVGIFVIFTALVSQVRSI
jgi:hypothetical protein